MNSKQENKLSMYLSVSGLCRRDHEICQQLPALVRAVAKLEAGIQNIQQLVMAQTGATAGIAADKLRRRERLTPIVVRIGRALNAYALSVDDPPLEVGSRITPSELGRCRDTAVVTTSRRILELAASHLANLADYGVTQARIDQARAEVDAYAALLPDPTGGRVISALTTERVTDAFAEVDGLLYGQLDSLALQLEESHPGFVEEYRRRRVIVDRPATLPSPSPSHVPSPSPVAVPAPS